MTTTSTQRPTREGSTHKRAAIIAAARELFVRDGFERTSMDAVAAAAKVSKRTVYDYYGDKRRLLLGVLEYTGQALVAAVHTAIDKYLSNQAEIHDAADLERALAGVAVQLGASVITSADYTAWLRLRGDERQQFPDIESHPLTAAPEEAMAERLAHFHELGIIEAPDPLLAAEHFKALTALLAYDNQPDPARADADKARQVMVEGVHAFMRAYTPRT